MTLKPHLLAIALLLGTSGYTLAGEPGSVLEGQSGGFSWTGSHIGLNVGHTWAGSRADFDLAGVHSDNDPQGYLGGGFAGYNLQLDNGIVLGGEADFGFSSADNQSYVYTGSVPDFSDIVTARLNWTASLRARLGYSIDRLLIFGTAGVGVADFTVNESFGGVNPELIDKTLAGWTAGAGVDYALTDRVFARLEYRYSDFGSMTSAQYPTWVPFEADLKTHDIRIGIAYKF